ncbi:MAG: AraC family transcriptional regulator [Prevotellaceae bacterium]|jgi:AraC-like DNA-binding protein|nr:AraC family transcriptional regulator [Prevotellaceae bacterium]
MTLIDTDLNEMFYIPRPSLSEHNGLEESRMVIDNCYVKASFTEIKMPHFSIMDGNVCCREDIKVYSYTETNDVLWFCAALQDNVAYFYDPMSREERRQSGQPNLISYNNINSYSCFKKNEQVRMLDIMLSAEYLEKIAAAYPSLLGDIVDRHTHHRLSRFFHDNIRFCPAISRALNDIMNYKNVGNAAPMYLDAKVLEILSLFLQRTEQKDCIACNCYSPKDNEKLIQAKEIIESQYLSPPSLHQLALMVGTNECKLKHGFKTLFGITVFGYLFDYRMNLASAYLLDTDKPIFEIAEAVGYEHQSHFSTAFKRKFMVSPQEYRNRKI